MTQAQRGAQRYQEATTKAKPADESKPTSLRDLERVLTEWNEATGALPRNSGWFYEVLGMMQDAFDLGVAQDAADGLRSAHNAGRRTAQQEKRQ